MTRFFIFELFESNGSDRISVSSELRCQLWSRRTGGRNRRSPQILRTSQFTAISTIRFGAVQSLVCETKHLLRIEQVAWGASSYPETSSNGDSEAIDVDRIRVNFFANSLS